MDEHLLSAYAFGELSDAERREVEAALAASPELHREVSRYRQLHLMLTRAAAEDVRVPDDLQARINQKVTVRSWLSGTLDLAPGVLGAYGRAIVHYLGLG